MTHSGQNFTEEVSSQLKRVREFQIFLKSKVALNVLLAKDDEEDGSRVKPKLLTKVPLETLEEDLECFVCQDPFGEKNEDGVIEDAVETPCHHLIGSSCANQWFIEEKHDICPFCRTSFPKVQYEYPNDKKSTPGWLAVVMLRPELADHIADVSGVIPRYQV